MSSLDKGLLRSWQSMAGVEASLPHGFELDVQGYYNDMNPVLFEVEFNESARPQSDQDLIHSMLRAQHGRAYGAEVMLRKRDNARLFGWLAYTLSRSERLREKGWGPFDFDRRHILNLVAGVHLPRDWDFGGRVQVQSGTPLVSGLPGRSPLFARLDLRVDKRVVWNNWILDFYVDVANVTYARDSGGLFSAQGVRLPPVPMFGVRAIL